MTYADDSHSSCWPKLSISTLTTSRVIRTEGKSARVSALYLAEPSVAASDSHHSLGGAASTAIHQATASQSSAATMYNYV